MSILWSLLGTVCAPLATPWLSLGTLEHACRYFTRPEGYFEQCWGDICVLRGTSLTPLGHPLDSTSTILGTWSQKGQKDHSAESLFELFQKRVHMQSDHACAVQTHIRALFLTLVFRPQKMTIIFSPCDFSLGHPRHIGGEGGTRRQPGQPRLQETTERG